MGSERFSCYCYDIAHQKANILYAQCLQLLQKWIASGRTSNATAKLVNFRVVKREKLRSSDLDVWVNVRKMWPSNSTRMRIRHTY